MRMVYAHKLETIAIWISFKHRRLAQFAQSWALPTTSLYSTCSVKCYRCWPPVIVCNLLLEADRGCSSWHTRLFPLCDVAEPGRVHMDHWPRVSQRRLTCWQWLWCESNLRTFAGTSGFIFSYRKQHFVTVREFLGVIARLEEDRFWASNQMVHSMGVGVKRVKFYETAGNLVEGVEASHFHAAKNQGCLRHHKLEYLHAHGSCREYRGGSKSKAWWCPGLCLAKWTAECQALKETTIWLVTPASLPTHCSGKVMLFGAEEVECWIGPKHQELRQSRRKLQLLTVSFRVCRKPTHHQAHLLEHQ